MTCEVCTNPTNSLVIHGTQLVCRGCLSAARGQALGSAPFVIGDDIPGGIDIKHGLCWPDGTPRKFYTKSGIREAAFEAGYFQGDDTPKTNHRISEERAHEKAARQRGR